MADLNYTPGDDDQESPVKYLTAVITSQPADVVGVIGGNAVFSFTYTTLIDLFTFQWEIQTDGLTWRTIANVATFYSGATTTALTVGKLDNFLASRTTLKFRCKMTWNGAVSFYTAEAMLTIPKYVSFTETPIGFAAADAGATASINLVPALVPTAIGFAGPYTYQWNFGGAGDAFTCSDPTIQSPTFTFAGAAGIHFSKWTCTISNGVDTITSSAYYLFAFFGPTTVTPAVQPTPPEVGNVETMTAPAGFIAPWAIATQQNYRTSTAFIINLLTPNAAGTEIFVTGGTLSGGQAVGAFPYCAILTGAPPIQTFCLGTAFFEEILSP